MKKQIFATVCFISFVFFSGNLQAQTPGDRTDELKGYVEALLDGSDPQAKQAALMAFGEIAGRADRKTLEAFKKDEDAYVRLGAGLGLLFSGDRNARAFVVNELRASDHLYSTLRLVVGPLSDEVQKPLVNDLLHRAKPNVRADVYRYLAGQSSELYGLLGSALVDRNSEVRANALTAVLAAPRIDALGFAAAMLKHRDETIRLAALDIAGAVQDVHGHSDAVNDLYVQALKDRSSRISERAARELVKVGHSGGVQKLVNALPGANSEMRKELLNFLLTHNARATGDVARKLLANDVQDHAEKALLFELDATTQHPETVETLLTMFLSEDFGERVIAARALGWTKDERARDALMRGLFEVRAEIRHQSARGLGLLADVESLPALQRAVSAERVKEIRLTIIDSLGKLKHPNAAQVLRFLVADSDADIKRGVIHALANIGLPEATSALEILMRDRNLELQWLAFTSLLSISSDVAMRNSATVLRNPPETFLNDLGQGLGQGQHELWQRLMTHNSDRIRIASLVRTTAFGDDAPVVYRKLLQDASTSDDVKREVIALLSARGDQSDVALFEALTRNTANQEVRNAALWALSRFRDNNAEATFRAHLNADSPQTRAIALYGLSLLK